MVRALYPTGIPDSRAAGFAQGIAIPAEGTLVFVSGQLGLLSNGRLISSTSVSAQARQAFENVAAVLREGGAAMSDVVKLTVFLRDMRHLPEVQRVRKDFWGDDPPTSSAVEIQGLVHPDALLEIEAVAVVPPRP